MKKEMAIKIIVDCAKDYHTHLENRNLLFLFGSSNKSEFFEASFLPRHFLHLTGAQIDKSHFSGSSDFYEKALKNNISPNDFSLSVNGTTEKKLLILPQLMKIYRSAKMVGTYNSIKSELYTEKLAGNVTACLGFVFDEGYYIPNTALKEDIRDITYKPQQRILAIFRKPITAIKYQELCYTAKGVNIDTLVLPRSMKGLLDLTPDQHKKKTFAEVKANALKKADTYNKSIEIKEKSTPIKSDPEL